MHHLLIQNWKVYIFLSFYEGHNFVCVLVWQYSCSSHFGINGQTVIWYSCSFSFDINARNGQYIVFVFRNERSSRSRFSNSFWGFSMSRWLSSLAVKTHWNFVSAWFFSFHSWWAESILITLEAGTFIVPTLYNWGRYLYRYYFIFFKVSRWYHWNGLWRVCQGIKKV